MSLQRGRWATVPWALLSVLERARGTL